MQTNRQLEICHQSHQSIPFLSYLALQSATPEFGRELPFDHRYLPSDRAVKEETIGNL